MKGPGRIWLYIYAKSRPAKDRKQDPTNRRKFNKQKENKYIVNGAVNEIFLQENQKVSAEKEAHENIEYTFNEEKLH